MSKHGGDTSPHPLWDLRPWLLITKTLHIVCLGTVTSTVYESAFYQDINITR